MTHQLQIMRLDQLPDVAAKLSDLIKNHRVIAFYGPMGVGKTTLIKALCKHWNVVSVVNSPTFALVNEYRTEEGNLVYHFDFYRINKIEEAYDFGYEDYFYSGHPCLIEWPEKCESLLPPDSVSVYLDEQPDGSRTVQVNV